MVACKLDYMDIVKHLILLYEFDVKQNNNYALHWACKNK